MKNIALVVPTIRENCIKDFVSRWEAIGLFKHVDLIIMEDNPARTFKLDIDCTHLCWEDIEDSLRHVSWIVPRRSDTVRSFAYWYAWKRGYEYILTLDDDCYPTGPADGLEYSGEAFVNEHLKYLNDRTKWFNTLNSVKPRGIPFFNAGKLRNTMVNHGLWTNVIDYDAPFQLANPIPEEFSYDNRIVPAGMFFPMCGMNVMWRSEVTVLMYHLLMGQVMTDTAKKTLFKLQFDRFGDIWCGIFMKKIIDGFGFTVSTGMPYIRHERASNPFTNLKKEANGIEVNEKLWEHVDKFVVDPQLGFNENYRKLGYHMKEFSDYPEHADYFSELGMAMVNWANLFEVA